MTVLRSLSRGSRIGGLSPPVTGMLRGNCFRSSRTFRRRGGASPEARRRAGIRVDSLFGRVVELVLVVTTEALLHAAVRPQSLHGRQQLVRERLRVLHPRYHVHDQLRVRLQRRTTPQMTM